MVVPLMELGNKRNLLLFKSILQPFPSLFHSFCFHQHSSSFSQSVGPEETAIAHPSISEDPNRNSSSAPLQRGIPNTLFHPPFHRKPWIATSTWGLTSPSSTPAARVPTVLCGELILNGPSHSTRLIDPPLYCMMITARPSTIQVRGEWPSRCVFKNAVLDLQAV